MLEVVTIGRPSLSHSAVSTHGCEHLLCTMRFMSLAIVMNMRRLKTEAVIMASTMHVMICNMGKLGNINIVR